MPRDSKTTRLRRHYQKFLSGHIRVQSDAPFREKFVEEFVSFPHGRHDDQVDATTQYLDYIAKRDDIDFSKTNVTRPGTIAVAFNSEYAPAPASPSNGSDIMALGLNSNRGFSSRPQDRDPKAPGLVAVSRPRRIFGW